MIYLLTEIGLPPGGSSTVHIYTQTKHRTTQNKQYIEQRKNFGRVRAVPVFAGYILAFALQLMKKHGEISVRLAEECQLVSFGLVRLEIGCDHYCVK
jgi:hypothetical protein